MLLPAGLYGLLTLFQICSQLMWMQSLTPRVDTMLTLVMECSHLTDGFAPSWRWVFKHAHYLMSPSYKITDLNFINVITLWLLKQACFSVGLTNDKCLLEGGPSDIVPRWTARRVNGPLVGPQERWFGFTLTCGPLLWGERGRWGASVFQQTIHGIISTTTAVQNKRLKTRKV